MAETVYDAVLGALTLKQVMNSDYSMNGNVIDGTASGAPDVSEYFGGESDPQATFDSADIAGVLAGLTVTGGLSVASSTITIPYAKRINGGTFAGAGTNNQINGTNGLIIPTGFRANQGDPAAMASLLVHFRSIDGITVPLTFSTDQNLAAQSFNAQYGLGPASINGTVISELQGIAVNPGITVIPQRSNGGLYPDSFFISQRRPTIDFIFENMDALAAYSPLFTVMTAAVAYFRKRSGVSYAADASLVHIKFSFADGITTAETIRASGVGNAQATLRCHGEVLTATAASAIT